MLFLHYTWVVTMGWKAISTAMFFQPACEVNFMVEPPKTSFLQCQGCVKVQQIGVTPKTDMKTSAQKLSKK